LSRGLTASPGDKRHLGLDGMTSDDDDDEHVVDNTLRMLPFAISVALYSFILMCLMVAFAYEFKLPVHDVTTDFQLRVMATRQPVGVKRRINKCIGQVMSVMPARG
jgi:hypothetical protein